MGHLMRELRGSVRHILALILAAGTTAGTVWTFSGGRLSLAGQNELIVSVGGVALALELGVLYCAVYLGNLAELAHSARNAARKDELERQYGNLFKWFLTVLAISVVANVWFRGMQLHNWALAGFVGVAPGPLILLFAVKLRRLPVDYAERARQTAQQAMAEVVDVSGRVMIRTMARIAAGEVLAEQEIRQLKLAGAFLLPRALPEERAALGDAMEIGTGAQLAIETTAITWLTSQEVADNYGIPLRTAQLWIKQLPGSAKQVSGRQVLADASRIYAQHGLPQPALLLTPERPSRAGLRSAGATVAADRATAAPIAEAIA